MSKVFIDKTDRKILQLLLRNARMPYLEIARECGISGAAIHQRVKKLDEQGIILGSRLEVNPRCLGYDVCALVNVRMQSSTIDSAIVEAVRAIPEVVECHFITGKYNMQLKLYCVDNDHFMRTLSELLKIPGVVATETNISLSEPFSRQVDVRHLMEEDL